MFFGIEQAFRHGRREKQFVIEKKRKTEKDVEVRSTCVNDPPRVLRGRGDGFDDRVAAITDDPLIVFEEFNRQIT